MIGLTYWLSMIILKMFLHGRLRANHQEKLKQDIPILKEITNSISLKVREQYEEILIQDGST